MQEKKMKNVRRIAGAAVFTLIFSLSAFAGDIHTGAPQPEPTPVTAQGDMHTMRAGDITTGNADADAVSDSVTGAALALIESVLSLF
jgi:hypothetical protein